MNYVPICVNPKRMEKFLESFASPLVSNGE